MAVAPLASVQRVLDYAVSEFPAQKVLLGIPNYAYDWTLPVSYTHLAASWHGTWPSRALWITTTTLPTPRRSPSGAAAWSTPKRRCV